VIRIFRVDGEGVRARLRQWAQALGEADSNVLAAVLFGSFARGDYTAASDADVLILLRESNLRFDERIPLYRPRRIGVSVDVFPYTLQEAKAERERGLGGGAHRPARGRDAILHRCFPAGVVVMRIRCENTHPLSGCSVAGALSFCAEATTCCTRSFTCCATSGETALPVRLCTRLST
jgi:predicted nucleotidyltransferase